jgi:hypothetical protein
MFVCMISDATRMYAPFHSDSGGDLADITGTQQHVIVAFLVASHTHLQHIGTEIDK